MKKIILIFTCMPFLSFGQTLISGKDDTSPVNPSATLELRSISGVPKGFLMPQHDQGVFEAALLNNIDDLDQPVTGGLLAYDSSSALFRYYNHKLDAFVRLNLIEDQGNRLNIYTNNDALDSRPYIEMLEDVGDLDRNGQLNLAGRKVSVWAGSTNSSVGTEKVIVESTGVTVNTDLTVSTAGTINGFGTIPLGGIIMWSGVSVPDGWALCDGTNGTPNLAGRFIVGTGQSLDGPTDYTLNQTGGEETHTLTLSEMPSHNHGGATSVDGQHSHQLATADGGNRDDFYGSPTHHLAVDNSGGSGAGYDLNRHTNNSASVTVFRSSEAGNHSHTINSEGGDQAHENRPPYYALAFIMRVQ